MSQNLHTVVHSASVSTTGIRILPVAGAGLEAFSAVVVEAVRAVDWLEGLPAVALEVVENENTVAVH